MSSLAYPGSSILGSMRSLLRVLALTVLCYLLQVSIVPHLKIGQVMPNLLMLCIAVLTVSKGKKYAFASGALIGILLETMAYNLSLFNLLLYPSLALLCAQIFSDMSELKRELLRIRIAQRQADRAVGVLKSGLRKRRLRSLFRRKTADDLDPHLRILLNTLMLTLLYELMMMVYIALDGWAIGFVQLGRLFRTLLYTGAVSILMFPARAFLGMYRQRRGRGKSDQVLGDVVQISEKELSAISLEPDAPPVRAAVQVAPPNQDEGTKTDDVSLVASTDLAERETDEN